MFVNREIFQIDKYVNANVQILNQNQIQFLKILNVKSKIYFINPEI